MGNNWIPTSERLPEYDELVLVTANSYSTVMMYEVANVFDDILGV